MRLDNVWNVVGLGHTSYDAGEERQFRVSTRTETLKKSKFKILRHVALRDMHGVPRAEIAPTHESFVFVFFFFVFFDACLADLLQGRALQ